MEEHLELLQVKRVQVHICYACMYICTYVLCMYVCMYVCMLSICMRLCMYVCTL